MISFSPGPSKVYDQLPLYFKDAFDQGILSANHRSAAFMHLYQETEELIKEKLDVPEGYKLLFTSSATENWEIITQSVVEKSSYHIFSGAFGKKWFGFARNINPATGSYPLDKDQELNPDLLEIDEEHDLIALTHNETSNATQVSNELIAAVGEKYKNKMVAVDATSSMAGVYLDFRNADIWYASVQKCFGLPAGLGVLILSPKAVEKVDRKGEEGRYNSLSFILENARNYQTHYTPNVLGIYLLNRSLKDVPFITATSARTEERMQRLEETVLQSRSLHFLIQNPKTRSRTVLGISGKEEFVSQVRNSAEAEGMQMGSGYGALKPTSFRIANFPAVTDSEFDSLIRFLRRF
ncbi:MAG TPA: aminotransferase class V-fold PLP-dependent enzyme [Cyclobacteriaceae bacterium]|nr:aminotransferase class V-fold PLP-dependent enzyme [Cyclobacteriaceae bacterium]